MEILNEQATNLESFSFLCKYFKGPLNNTPESYHKFKQMISNFTRDLMILYLKDTPCRNNNCHCFIVDNQKNLGSYNPKFNIIFINESIIKKSYNKKDFSFLHVIFHELNHFKIKFDIEMGHLDKNLVKVIKEDLIHSSPSIPYFIKAHESERKNTYYQDNYEFYFEEKLADLYALDNLLFFLKKANIPLYAYQREQLNRLISKTSRESKMDFRDVSANMHFNSYIIDFNEAFDILIKDNPQWLEYSQLQIEYYIDEHNCVKKRSKEELNALLLEEINPDTIEYIQHLLSDKKQDSNYMIRSKSILNHKILPKDIKISNKL